MITKDDCRVIEKDWSAYDIDYTRWVMPKPFGISGFVPAKNEEDFLEAAVLSHVLHFDEVNIILQNSTDRTDTIARRLAHEIPTVRVHPYTPAIAGPGTADHKALPANSVRSLVHFYNWCLTRCSYAWAAKFDADSIALESLQDIRWLIENMPDRPYGYGRYCLNLAGPNFDHVYWPEPRNGGFDHAVFPNYPSWHYEKREHFEALNLAEHAGEHAPIGFSFFHLKWCKPDGGMAKYRLDDNPDSKYHVLDGCANNPDLWIPFTRPAVTKALRDYNKKRPFRETCEIIPAVLFDPVPWIEELKKRKAKDETDARNDN